MDMLYCDSAIMVFDEKSENGLFHLVNLNNLDSIYDFGKKGQGLDEFLMPFDFQLFSKKAISVYDLYKKYFFSCPLAIAIAAKKTEQE